MSRFLFVTWPGAGNQAPAIGLARQLRRRGHTVRFAGYADQRPRFEQLGYGFRVLPGAQRAWPKTPPPDWMHALVDAVWACPQHLTDLPDLLAREPYEYLVVDCLMYGALAVAEAADLPAAVLVHSAPGALAPPGGDGERLMLGAVNAVRADAGLQRIDRLWDAWSRFPTLCTSVRELDPLASAVPPSFEFVGPIPEPAPTSGWAPPWPADDPRPLVTASFSTGQAWDQTSRIHRTLEALDDGRHRVLVTTALTEVDGISVPRDAALTEYVPHADVLPGCAATVCHAGHGTVAASLTHGVPVISLPNPAADQPALAEQVARLGAGVALDGEAATSADVADAVHAVLTDARYASAARRLADAIAATRGAAAAADAIERVVAGDDAHDDAGRAG